MANHHVLENHIYVLVCELMPCAVNWKEFSNILVSRLGHKQWEPWLLNSKKNKKMIRNTWNLAWCHDMAPRFCGKRIGHFDESFGTHLSQIGASHEKARGSEREEYACLMTNWQWLPLMAWHFFSTVNIHEYNFHVKIWKFSGVIWHF